MPKVCVVVAIKGHKILEESIMAETFASYAACWKKGLLLCGVLCLALWGLYPVSAYALIVNAYDDSTYSDALDEVNAGNADTIVFGVNADTIITAPGTTLNNDASFINNSGFAVEITNHNTNNHGLDVASNVTLDFSGASPLTIATSGTSSMVGLYGNGVSLYITSLGANTVIIATSDNHQAYGIFFNGAVDIGTLSGSVSATSGTQSTYGLFSNDDLNIGTLSGSMNALSNGFSAIGLYSSIGDITINTLSGTVNVTAEDDVAYGFYTRTGNIDITTLSGTVSVTDNNDEAYGFSARDDLSITTLSGSVSATSNNQNAYGLFSNNAMSITTLSGTVSATSDDLRAYGLHSFAGDIDIGTLSGTVSATSENSWTFGIRSNANLYINTLSGTISAKSEGNGSTGIHVSNILNGGDAATPVRITGTISAIGVNHAAAIETTGAANLYLSGTLYAEDTSGSGNAWALRTGAADDLLTLDTGASLTGLVDLGGGNDLLTLLGMGTLANTFQNIETLNVGDGATLTNWIWGSDASLTNTNTVDILSNATLLIDQGVTVNNTLNVKEGGTLGGYGTVANDVNNAGTVSPGGSIGTLTINGDYTQTATGTLYAEVDANSSDQLHVSGTANLDGALVIVPETGDLFSSGTSWEILLAYGGINGTFSATSVLYDSPTLTFSTTQSGISMDVEVERTTPYTAFARSSRTKSLSRLLTDATNDATGEMAQMLAGLDFSSADAISNAMESLSAESYDAFSQSALEGGRALTTAQRAGLRSGGVASGRQFAGNFNHAPNSATGLAAGERVGEACIAHDVSMFLQPFSSYASQDSSSDRTGYDATTWGFTAGLLYHPSPNWTFGIAPGFFSQNIDQDGLGDGKGTVVEWSVAALAGYHTDALYLDAMARFGFDRYTSSKYLLLPDMPRTANAYWTGTNLTFALGGGYDFHEAGFTFGPVASLAWSTLNEDSIEEDDAGQIGQKISARDTQSLNTELGARVTRAFETSVGTITPEVQVSWNAEWFDGGRSITSSFIGYNGSYSVDTADNRYHAGQLDAGVTWGVSDSLNIMARTSVEFAREDHNAISGGLRLEYLF